MMLLDQKKTLQGLDIPKIVAEAIAEHGAHRDALIPILSEVNKQVGYIPPEAFREVSQQLRKAPHGPTVYESQLYGIASFYQMFSTRPLGRHVVRFCESAPCHVMGGRQVFTALQEALGLQPGETSPDNKWSLITTSCLGICGVGPVFLIDEDVYGNLTPEQLPEILAQYE